MRNIERIPVVLEKIKSVWLQNPDLRLCQLLENVKPDSLNDMYYIEDDKLIELLDLHYNTERSNND